MLAALGIPASIAIATNANADPATATPTPTPTPTSTSTSTPTAPKTATASPPPLPPHPLNELVSLELDDQDLTELIRVIGQVTGKRFLIASPRVSKVKASIYSPQKVTAGEAYQALLAVLSQNGLTVVPQGGFYRIVDSQDIGRQVTPFERGAEVSPEERYVTRIHRLSHLGADEVATGVLAKLASKDASIVPYAPGNLLIITETGANLRRMVEILDTIDRPGTDAKLYFQPILHVSAQLVEKQLDAILDLKKQQAAPGGELFVGRVVAVDRPNALVIVASPESYVRILDLLQHIDVLEPNETQVHVVPLQYADAKKIVGPIADAIGGTAGSTASSGAGASAGARGGSSAPSGPTSVSTGPLTVLEGPAKVSADDTTNSLIVTASVRDFQNIKEVITALDRPKRQVFIEAVILDISADSGLDLGVAWHGGNIDTTAKGNLTEFGGFRASSSALPPSTSDLQGLALGIRGPDIPFNTGIPGITTIPSIGAFLTAAATDKGTDILSTPSITASDNTAAEIKVQLNESLQPHAPLPSQYTTGSFPGALPPAATGVTANYKAIGPRVKITPHLNDSNDVRLDIEEVISDIASEPAAGDTYGTVSFIERSATTTMTVKDGSTAVIGGLVRNIVRRSENKVPILGDVPILGALFRTRSDQTEKSNLVLILTPYIIRGEDDMRRVVERKKEERQELIDHAAVFSANSKWKPPVDYKKTRGLLAHMEGDQRVLDHERRDAEAVPARDTSGPVAQVPMDLPVPLQTWGNTPGTAAPKTEPAKSPSGPAPISPPVQVRTVQNVEH
jgi:general secretion pathway protein D